MATVPTKIRQALKARVGSTIAGMPVTWGDDGFTPPQSGGVPQPYVLAENVANTPERVMIKDGGKADRRGILTLTIMYPVALGHTLDAMTEKQGLVAEALTEGRLPPFQGVSVRISQTSGDIAPYRDDAYYRCPVQAQWQTYA